MDYDVWIFIWITKWRTDDRNKLPNVHENTTTQGFLVAINKGLQLVIMNLAARWWWFVEVWGPTLMLSTEDPALFLEVIRSPTCLLQRWLNPITQIPHAQAYNRSYSALPGLRRKHTYWSRHAPAHTPSPLNTHTLSPTGFLPLIQDSFMHGGAENTNMRIT